MSEVTLTREDICSAEFRQRLIGYGPRLEVNEALQLCDLALSALDREGRNEAIAATHKDAVLESVCFICNAYANEGDRVGKEYVHETVAELVARIRALKREPNAGPDFNVEANLHADTIAERFDAPEPAPAAPVAEMVRRLDDGDAGPRRSPAPGASDD